MNIFILKYYKLFKNKKNNFIKYAKNGNTK